jgi:hypothetical protein
MAVRSIPEFHKEKGRVDNYFISAASILIAAIIIISAVFGERKDLNGILIGIEAPLLAAAAIAAAVLLLIARSNVQKDRKAWLGTSREAEAEIMERRDATDKDWQAGLTTARILGLKPVPAQLEITPGESVVWVGISRSQYWKYAGKGAVRIIYSSEDPFEFLLEDEIKIHNSQEKNEE